jgi:hypothetical protein
MRIVSLEGYFVIFSGTRDFSRIIFKNQGSGCKILDRRLIFQKSRGLCARFLNSTKIMNYFNKGNPVDQVHGRWTTAGSCGPLWTDGSADGRTLGHGGVLAGV